MTAPISPSLSGVRLQDPPDPAPPGVAPQPSSTSPAEPSPAPAAQTTPEQPKTLEQAEAANKTAEAQRAERQGPIVRAQAAFDSAHAEVVTAEKKLDEQLAELAPGLTDEQHQQYIEEYRKERAGLYAAEDAAATQLKQALSATDLDQVARDYPGFLPDIQQALSSLAQSSQGRSALDWLSSKFGPGAGYEGKNPYEANGFAFHKETIASIVETATTSAAGAIAGSSDVAGEARKLLGSLQDLANAGIGGSLTADGARLLAKLQPLTPGAGARASVASIQDAYRSGGTPGMVAAAYVVTGALVAAGLVEGVGDTPAEQAKFLGDLAVTVQGGAEFTGRMLSSASGILKHGVLASEGFALGMERAVPIAGAIGAVLYTLSDSLNTPESGLEKTKFLADAFTASVMFLAPSSILPLIGIGISAICGLLISREENRGRHDEEAKLLTRMGVDPAAARVMADQAGEINTLAAVPGLGAEQIQQLAATHPGLFAHPDNVAVFAAAVQEAGLRGDEITGFADALAAGTSGEATFGQLATTTANSSLVPVIGGDRYAGPTALRGIESLHATQAIDFLDQHAPEVMARTEARESADSRYLSSPNATNSPAGLVELLDAIDDPAYRGRIIENIVHGAGDSPEALLSIAQRIASDPAASAAFAQAIGDAVASGALPLADANATLQALGASELQAAPTGTPLTAV